INAVEWDEQIDDTYGVIALPFFKSQMLKLASSTVVPILNKSGFSRVRIPVPPKARQNQFSRRVEKIHFLKSKERRSLGQLEILSASLRHRAFRGEL
ncbi:MAG: hypothetical protein ACOC5M_01810, partial [Chloroflexota bacterium]